MNRLTAPRTAFWKLLVMLPFGLFFLLPFVWMMLGSFKHSFNVNKWIAPLTWDNYVLLFRNTPAVRWFLNSVYVSLSATLLICLLSALAGYAFAKIRFQGSNLIFFLMISTMMLPKYVLLVPLFKLIRDLGWFNTYSALIFPELGYAFGVFMMRQFIQSIPTEMIEATRMDGASELRIFFQMIVPLVKPALAALAIFSVVRVWNDFMWQLVVTQSEEMKTMPLGVAGFTSMAGLTDYGMMMAGAAVASLPIMILFLCFQRFFTRGITMGAMKG
ncbi:carbohydrate ABC transporter permease [Paenibacillus thalictri]|uniref:Carbohydrate ABC transporter permease n=1 Tax=Paenibacillus thalictri TaxID=2527873 RepID=A0A4Q9DNX0_9BACL|nr:carbohydrate ABC transporter permease [Paenibacillus thalictri]TBL76263.1 carbohydrate ABC transporter permease [Paenibacillus thalictri]